MINTTVTIEIPFCNFELVCFPMIRLSLTNRIIKIKMTGTKIPATCWVARIKGIRSRFGNKIKVEAKKSSPNKIEKNAFASLKE